MKYIRTKNGIYEYVGYDDGCIIPSPIVKYTTTNKQDLYGWTPGKENKEE